MSSSIESGPRSARLKSLEAWPGLDGLVAAQAASGSYWFLGRNDYRRLSKVAESWAASDDPVHQLLATKVNRGIVCDPDQLPSDVATIGARVKFRIGNDTETCVITEPAATQDVRDSIPVVSRLGALLLGMLEGRSLRGQGPDGTAFTISVETVVPAEASPISAAAGTDLQADVVPGA